jgi:hypothetical protein
MFYISFHGGSGNNAINNINVYSDDAVFMGNLLQTDENTPPLSELRSFRLVNDLLYVVNAYKHDSNVLMFKQTAPHSYAYSGIYTSPAAINGIDHPYDICFDDNGNGYVSSQDSNVVTGITPAQTAMPLAPFLGELYEEGTFLAGTFVASGVGNLPGLSIQPTIVPPLQGLTAFIDQENGKVTHSVRGLTWYDGYLYVCNQADYCVNVYNSTGQLWGTLNTGPLSSPTQLLNYNDTLYISSSHDKSVYTYDLALGVPGMDTTPTLFLDGIADSVSGMCFDQQSNFYIANRKQNRIERYDNTTKTMQVFLGGLADNPEFIQYVPND